jgi:hypothetical protein
MNWIKKARLMLATDPAVDLGVIASEAFVATLAELVRWTSYQT